MSKSKLLFLITILTISNLAVAIDPAPRRRYVDLCEAAIVLYHGNFPAEYRYKSLDDYTPRELENLQGIINHIKLTAGFPRDLLVQALDNDRDNESILASIDMHDLQENRKAAIRRGEIWPTIRYPY